MAEQTLLALVHPQNNGVHFLNPAGPDRKLALDVVHTILAQYNIQRGWTHPSGFPVNSQGAKAYNPRRQAQPSPITLLANTMVHVVDIYSDSPEHIYHQLADAFSIPEYYGYSLDTLHLFLTDLTWLQMKHHVLLLSIPATAKILLDLHSLWTLLDQVAQTWKAKGVAFLTFVLQGKNALAFEAPRM